MLEAEYSGFLGEEEAVGMGDGTSSNPRGAHDPRCATEAARTGETTLVEEEDDAVARAESKGLPIADPAPLRTPPPPAPLTEEPGPLRWMFCASAREPRALFCCERSVFQSGWEKIANGTSTSRHRARDGREGRQPIGYRRKKRRDADNPTENDFITTINIILMPADYVLHCTVLLLCWRYFLHNP